jgi:hypothetical protein
VLRLNHRSWNAIGITGDNKEIAGPHNRSHVTTIAKNTHSMRHTPLTY